MVLLILEHGLVIFLSGSELDSSDGYIDQNINIDETSIYSIINSSDESLSNLIRGPNSLGSIFERNDYTALPSSRKSWSTRNEIF